MKRVIVICAGFVLAFAPARAGAQVFGQLGGAQTLGMNAHLAGGYVAFSKSETALLAQLRMSFYPSVDFGFQGGLSRVRAGGTDRTSVNLGGDFKAQVAKHSDHSPIDFALGAAIGVRSAEDFNLLSVGPTAVVSRTYALRGGMELTPYVGAALMFTRSDLNNGNSTDLSVPLRFGNEWKLNADVRLLTELQLAVSDEIQDDVRFTIGANFPF